MKLDAQEDTRDTIYAKLNQLAAATFHLEKVSLTPQTAASDVEGWDSSGHVRFIFAIEQAFGFRFATAEVGRLRNVGQLVDAILARLNPR